MKSKFMDNIRARMDSCGTAAIKYLLFVFNLIFARKRYLQSCRERQFRSPATRRRQLPRYRVSKTLCGDKLTFCENKDACISGDTNQDWTVNTLVSGLILLIAGIIVLLDVNDYQHFVEDKLMAPPVVLIVVGTFVFLVASLGCYGAIKESPKLLNAFAVFLLIVLLIEVAVAIAAIVFKADLENALETQLEKSITRHNSADMVAWNTVHKNMMCCGIQGPKDWYDSNNKTMPASCCKPDLIDPDTNDCKNAPPLFMDRYYQEGCSMKLKQHFDKNAVVLIAVGFAIAAFQLLGVIFACWLSASIKRDKN